MKWNILLSKKEIVLEIECNKYVKIYFNYFDALFPIFLLFILVKC